ncbi:hypothetical protein L1987_53959 [Smallanthus sonchifolius]|uniref:Uncharacterized protein n=1 Tax=Smallanthus sonchifolius TaxID=185202 RepID=A0ACB9E6W8_9ASTR|nr:hypothetical protein L1987_53959 [Smallanthus sonchifolius]
MGDDSEGDYQEVATTVQVSKKQHRPRYIAPMSMNRLANLAKQNRVIAPKVSHKFQLDSNATKENHTVGDLILRKKCPQRQMEASKQNYEIHGDDSDKDLENEDDVLVEEQLEGHELEKAIVTEEKDIVGKFSQFLGTIARNHNYASLIHNSWHKVPHKDKIWEYVLVRKNTMYLILLELGF